MSAKQNEKVTKPELGMALEALKRGVRQELKIHKALGNPIAEWRDGKVVWIPATEIQIDEEESTPNTGSAQ
jgi:hypothetical protein